MKELITDTQIRELRKKLFDGPADARQLRGIVACSDALGRSHRRDKARELCAAIYAALNLSERTVHAEG